MRILILSSLYRATPPFGAGSIENFVHKLASRLISDYQCEVTVLCKENSVGGSYTTIPTDFDAFRENTLAAVKDFKPDLIHAHFDDLKLFRELQSLDIPVIYTIHSYAEPSQWLEMISEADTDITFSLVSESLRGNLFKVLDDNKIQHFKNKFVTTWIGIDVEYYRSNVKPSPKEHFLYLGLVRKHKAILELIEAFSICDEKLLIAGPLKDIPYCQTVLEEAEKYSNVVYYGEAKTDKEKITLLSKTKALVLATGFSELEPDCQEAFGLVMVEANACGVPVIGYAQGAMLPYIKEGRNGFLFRNIQDLQNLVKSDNFVGMEKECIRAASKYDIQGVIENYYELYKQVLSERN